MATLSSSGIVLLLALGASVLLGCNRARVEGDTVFLPARSSLLELERKRPAEMPFKKFSGSYPDEWFGPELPGAASGELYLAGSSEIVDKTRGWCGPDWSLRCLMRLEPEEAVSRWLTALDEANWTVIGQEQRPACRAGGYLVPGVVTISAEYPTYSASDFAPAERLPSGEYVERLLNQKIIHIYVKRHRNMDGWTCFDVSVISSFARPPL